VMVYQVHKNKKLSLIESVQAHKFGRYVTKIIPIVLNGNECLITGGNDQTIKVWSFYKGKLRLLKTIPLNENVSNIIYLENYKMIVTTHHKNYVKFFRIPSGMIQTTLELDVVKARSIFLLKDKNLLGVADLVKNCINIVQLHARDV